MECETKCIFTQLLLIYYAFYILNMNVIFLFDTEPEHLITILSLKFTVFIMPPNHIIFIPYKAFGIFWSPWLWFLGVFFSKKWEATDKEDIQVASYLSKKVSKGDLFTEASEREAFWGCPSKVYSYSKSLVSSYSFIIQSFSWVWTTITIG
jgi:hypothetical protein